MAKPGKGPAPLKFGRYNALTKLGQGAMATVYLAEDPSLNRMVAIKVIHSHLSSNANLLDRFTVEAKTAASLRNPNIVEIFDYGLEEGAQYLVMEYIDGPNLQFVLNLLGGHPMTPEVTAAIICQAADGLITAEKFGVVHRDIKPENMMFKSEGVLKIADFGIAHISEQNLTQTGSILGSPNFMSPEQIDGKKPSHLTDMFSLGAVFYYCLTGRKPFSGSNIPMIMRHICDLPHAPVSSIVPDADPYLENLVDTLLQKAPEDRGKGARWLSLQLRSYLNQKGLLDLTDITKALLETTGNMGNQTVVDLTPASPPEEARKAPLKPGMKMEKAKAVTSKAGSGKPGTGIRPGTGSDPRSSGVRPGTGIRPGTGSDPRSSGVRSGTGIRPGTWQAGPNQGNDSDFNGNGTGSGGGNKHLFMWIGAGLLAITLLTVAVVLVLGSGSGGSNAAKNAAAKSPKAMSVEKVSLQPGSMELQAGQKRRFIVEIEPHEAPANVRWESDDASVANVQEGEVWAQRPGQTTIRAISMQDATKQGSAEVIVSGAVVADADYLEKPVDRPIVKPVKEPAPIVKPSPVNQAKTPPTEGEDGKVSKNLVTDKPAEKPAPVKAFLTISSAPPFAEVIVDGRFMGTTPVKDKELNPGRHKLQITHRNFPPVDTVINLGPGEKKIHFRLFR
ncbi:MAG: protein kinase [Fibrobacterota bacterium]|nr:protein kinase [Fibrobacterota bacterium]